LGISKLRRVALLCEAKDDCLARTTRAGREGLTVPRWASAAAWELAGTAGLLRKHFRTPKSAD
jgi:hypothetical protein